MTCSYFLSDIHIKSSQDEKYKVLDKFLSSTFFLDPGDIYLVGDIFDLWVSDHSVFTKQYHSVIQSLKTIKSAGYQIYYFEGNHDLHLKKFWQDHLGFKVISDILYTEIGNKIFRIEHGDLINIQDKDYLKLRAFLRNPYMTFLAHHVSGYFWNFIGKKWSHQSRRQSASYLENKKNDVIAMIREYANKTHVTKKFDYIITGHMHVFDDFIFESENQSKVRSINLGSWFEGYYILKYKDDNFSRIQL